LVDCIVGYWLVDGDYTPLRHMETNTWLELC
jgi:hypothetical protein